MPSSHLILSHPLLLLPPIPPSIRVFSNESTLRVRWPKYWSFSFSISPSKEHPGLISFRMDGLDLLAVQGTLKSLLQHHSSLGFFNLWRGIIISKKIVIINLNIIFSYFFISHPFRALTSNISWSLFCNFYHEHFMLPLGLLIWIYLPIPHVRFF